MDHGKELIHAFIKILLGYKRVLQDGVRNVYIPSFSMTYEQSKSGISTLLDTLFLSLLRSLPFRFPFHT